MVDRIHLGLETEEWGIGEPQYLRRQGCLGGDLTHERGSLGRLMRQQVNEAQDDRRKGWNLGQNRLRSRISFLFHAPHHGTDEQLQGMAFRTGDKVADQTQLR